MQKPEPLISVEELAAMLDEPAVRLVDCRFSLADPELGRRQYLEAHIPGAVYADLDRDLAAKPGEGTGRHPLPDPDAFVDTLRRWGISSDSYVVVYDDAGGGIAARLWWLLHWLGHSATALLDGGFDAWCRAGLPLASDAPAPSRGDFSGSPDIDATWSTADVARMVEAGDPFTLADARDPARFHGEQEPIDPVAGHVPGAVNLPFASNLDARGRWRSPDELVRAFAAAGIPPQGRDWGVMCGSGVTACHLAVAARLAGIPAPRVYVGSWSEWVADRRRPVAGRAAPGA